LIGFDAAPLLMRRRPVVVVVVAAVDSNTLEGLIRMQRTSATH
jgi:hypothetical protein